MGVNLFQYKTLATFPTKVYFSMFKFGTFKVISYFCTHNSKTMKLQTNDIITSHQQKRWRIGIWSVYE